VVSHHGSGCSCCLRDATRYGKQGGVLKLATRFLIVASGFALASCATKDRDHTVRVSVADQKMLVFKKGVEIARYDVSTSKFGVAGRAGSYTTPLGAMEVARKVGKGARSGMKFKSRRPTGEIVAVNSPGRDPIVSRILWLRGLERGNRDTYSRCIYIHGTPEEWRIGTPASYGCIRMRSHDVIQLFNTLGEGARVEVTMSPFPPQIVRAGAPLPASTAVAGAAPAPTPTPVATAHGMVKRG